MLEGHLQKKNWLCLLHWERDSLSARIHFQIFYHQYLAQDLAFGECLIGTDAHR